MWRESRFAMLCSACVVCCSSCAQCYMHRALCLAYFVMCHVYRVSRLVSLILVCRVLLSRLVYIKRHVHVPNGGGLCAAVPIAQAVDSDDKEHAVSCPSAAGLMEALGSHQSVPSRPRRLPGLVGALRRALPLSAFNPAPRMCAAALNAENAEVLTSCVARGRSAREVPVGWEMASFESRWPSGLGVARGIAVRTVALGVRSTCSASVWGWPPISDAYAVSWRGVAHAGAG